MSTRRVNADVRGLALKLRASLNMIGDGDWTPQDMAASRLCDAVLGLRVEEPAGEPWCRCGFVECPGCGWTPGWNHGMSIGDEYHELAEKAEEREAFLRNALKRIARAHASAEHLQSIADAALEAHRKGEIS